MGAFGVLSVVCPLSFYAQNASPLMGQTGRCRAEMPGCLEHPSRAVYRSDEPMATIDTRALQSSATDLSAEQKRIVRALTECMTALEIAPDLYTVIGENQGPEYTVDTRVGRCTCPDASYRLDEGQPCKHELRVRYATGEREIPDWVDEDAIDPLLGMHLSPTESEPEGRSRPDESAEPETKVCLELLDTGGGWLVFEQQSTDRDTASDTERRLLGVYEVTDWDELLAAAGNLGYTRKGVTELPEYETIDAARDAATEGVFQ